MTQAWVKSTTWMNSWRHVLAGALAVSLAACGSASEPSTAAPTATTTPAGTNMDADAVTAPETAEGTGTNNDSNRDDQQDNQAQTGNNTGTVNTGGGTGEVGPAHVGPAIAVVAPVAYARVGGLMHIEVELTPGVHGIANNATAVQAQVENYIPVNLTVSDPAQPNRYTGAFQLYDVANTYAYPEFHVRVRDNIGQIHHVKHRLVLNNTTVVHTTLQQRSSVAGDTVTVQCALDRPGMPPAGGEAFALEAYPAVTELTYHDDGRVTFVPTRMGPVDLRCTTADGYFRDTLPETLQVLPAAAVSVVTVAEEDAVTGEAVPVHCTVRDGFDNTIWDAPGLRLSASPGLDIRTLSLSRFEVRSTVPGTFQVQCMMPGAVATPTEGITIHVGTGPVARVQTLVTKAYLQPGEEVTARCETTDAFGNPVAARTVIDVHASDNTPDEQAGLVREGDTFSATRAGTYSATCVVPLAELRALAGLNEDGTGASSGAASPASPATTAFGGVPFQDLRDTTSAIVAVQPGKPFAFKPVDNLERLTCYVQDEILDVRFDVFDRHDNLIHNPPLVLTSQPPQAMVLDHRNRLRPKQDGVVRFSVTVAPEHHAEGATIGTYRNNVVVDTYGPEITIHWPPEGAMIEAGSSHVDMVDVPVSGTIVDATTPLNFGRVAGDSSIIPGGAGLVQPFSVTTQARWGLSTVVAYATDACGNSSRVVRSFLRGHDFLAHNGGELTEDVPGAASAMLRQEILDDYDRSDLDDVATIAQTVMNNLDYNALLPPGCDGVLPNAQERALNHHLGQSLTEADVAAGDIPCQAGHMLAHKAPVVEACNDGDEWLSVMYWVYRDKDTHVRAGKADIHQITLTNHSSQDYPDMDAMYLDLQLDERAARPGEPGVQPGERVPALDIPLVFRVGAHTCINGGEGRIGPIEFPTRIRLDDLRLQSNMGLFVDESGANVELPYLSPDLNGLSIELGCGGHGPLQDACDEATALAAKYFEDNDTGIIAGLGREMMPPVIESILNDIRLTMAVPLPEPIGVPLVVGGELEAFDIDGPSAERGSLDANIEARLSARVSAGQQGEHVKAWTLGPLVRGGDDVGFTLNDAQTFGVGLKDDLINQLLWATWYAGGLTIPAEKLAPIVAGFGFAGIDLSVEAKLPPVLMPGKDGYDYDIGLGDLVLDIVVDVGELLELPISVDPLAVRVTTAAIIGANAAIDPAADVIELDVRPEAEIEFQIDHLGPPRHQGLISEVVTDLVHALYPYLVKSMVRSTPMPQLDVSGMAGLPEGTVWKLTEGELTRFDGAVRIQGALQHVQ